MGRDTLRELEDFELGLKTTLKSGRVIFSVKTAIYLVGLLIKQEKRIRKLEKILDKHT